MARKRRKSKARKRRRKKPARSSAGGGSAVAIEQGEAPVTVDLSDDEIVDAGERERLIAAAARLPVDIDDPTAGSDDLAAAGLPTDIVDPTADVVDPAAASGDPGTAATDPGTDPVDPVAPVTDRGAPSAEDVGRAARALPEDDSAGGSEIPALTPAALAALSEIHHEGLASLPSDMVLDLGAAASEVERDRILAAALAHVDMQDAIYRVPTEEPRRGGWKGLLAASLLAVALLTLLRPPAFVVPPAGLTVEATDRVRGVHLALLLQAEQIEAFRSREDRLPDSLADLDHVVPGVRFVRSSNRLYQLVAFGPDGRAIVYDSAAPGPRFDAIDRPWAGGGQATS